VNVFGPGLTCTSRRLMSPLLSDAWVISSPATGGLGSDVEVAVVVTGGAGWLSFHVPTSLTEGNVA